MLYLNFSNVEELVFSDRSVQSLLPPHMFSVFEQWRLAQFIPSLRDIGKRAVLDFLNELTHEEIDTLEKYFQEKIVVEKLNYSLAFNIKVPLSETIICEELCKIEGFSYFSISRDNEHLYVSAWK